jgi:hypothetical protein
MKIAKRALLNPLFLIDFCFHILFRDLLKNGCEAHSCCF